jgi:transposase InsO family protein
MLVSQLFSRFGCPRQILSDQGPEFNSQLMAELCKNLRIDKVRTSAYKASTNGAVERFHRTLNSMLGKVILEHQKDWDLWVPIVMAAYRASPHSATKVSPNKLILGRETDMPIDIVLGLPEEEREEATSYEAFTDNLALRLESAFEMVRRNLDVAAERRKAAYDLRVKGKEFSVGQWVWYYNPRKYRGRTPKWQRLYTGPFLIVRELPPSNFVIQRTKNAQPKVVHTDKLKAWGGDPLPSWLDKSANTGDDSTTNEVEPTPEAIDEPIDNEGQQDREGAQAIADDGSENAIGSDVEVARPSRPVRERRRPCRLADYKL